MGYFKDERDILVNVDGSGSVATLASVHSDIAAQRITFLSSFSPEEDKAIRRKVDWRFLWLIGVMYITKNVRNTMMQCGRH